MYVVGIINAESAWGETYARLGAEGDPIFREARLLLPDQVLGLAEDVGFRRTGAWSVLLEPSGTPLDSCREVEGVRQGAGFVALGFQKSSV